VCQDAAVKIAGTQKEKGREETEQRCVDQLEERSYNTWQDDRRGQDRCEVGLVMSLMSDDVLIEVMQMCKAEDEGRAKDNVSWFCLYSSLEPTAHDIARE